MKEQHRIETPHQRHQRGLRMSGDDLGDLAYLRGIEATLTPEQREQFDEICTRLPVSILVSHV